MTKSEYVSNVYVGRHEKHEYHVSLWRYHRKVVELSVVYGRKALIELLSGCYDWIVNDITTGECNIDIPELTKGAESSGVAYDD